MPGADRVVVEHERFCDFLARPSPVEKDQGVGASGHAMLFKPVPRDAGKCLSFGVAEKTCSDHAASFGDSPTPVKKRLVTESGYTNYFRSILAREGLVVLSPNAGAVRLLLPQQLEHCLSEIQHSKEVIISRGPWIGGCNDDIELLFDDNSNNPSCMYISEEQCMTVPEPGVWDFTRLDRIRWRSIPPQS
jgi:hypothetical protein